MVGRDRRARRCNKIAVVNPRRSRKAIICFAFIAALLTSEPVNAQSASRSASKLESSAVDVIGIRHRPSDYGDKRTPWMADRIKFVQPNYPTEARARQIQGTGLFRIALDINTGSVSNVAVVKSTGSSVLDDSAIRAIRLWRWRPSKWKEVEIPVAFTLGPRGHYGGSADEVTARGRAYYIKGDNASAIKTLDEAVRLEPTFAEAYIIRGSASQAAGQRNKALADFNKAIQLDPKSARAYCDRAILEDELLRQPDKALADFNKAIQLAPNFQRAYFDRGGYFRGRHNYEGAITDFTRAIQLMPTDFSAYGQRAYSYARQGDHPGALADANVAIRLKPASDFYLWRATDFRLRAEAYRILGRMELALGDLRESLRSAPNNPEAHYELARFLATCPEDRFRSGVEAVSIAKKACEISDWENSWFIDTLATAYAEAGAQ